MQTSANPRMYDNVKKAMSKAEDAFTDGIERHDGFKISLPKNMSLSAAQDALAGLEASLEEDIDLRETFAAWPLDGAVAAWKAITNTFGFTGASASKNDFCKSPPEIVNVQLSADPDDRMSIPWGEMSLPHGLGGIKTSWDRDTGHFRVVASIKKKYMPILQEIFAETRRIIKDESIYAGKSIALDLSWMRNSTPFNPNNHQPRFIDVSDVDEESCILPRHIDRALRAFLFGPISNPGDLSELNIRNKRVTLLGGDAGTGKTTAGRIAAKKANDNGRAYILLEDTRDLPFAIPFADLYNAVIFCEDIDRITDGERSSEMDQILNVIDGVEFKSSNIHVIFTTNKPNNINRYMIRPGRIDDLIVFERPDAEAASRLVKHYCGKFLDPETDLVACGEAVKGQIPAVIESICQKSMLVARYHNPDIRSEVDLIGKITTEDIVSTAAAMKPHIDLVNRKDEEPPRDVVDEALRTILTEFLQDRGVNLSEEQKADTRQMVNSATGN